MKRKLTHVAFALFALISAADAMVSTHTDFNLRKKEALFEKLVQSILHISNASENIERYLPNSRDPRQKAIYTADEFLQARLTTIIKNAKRAERNTEEALKLLQELQDREATAYEREVLALEINSSLEKFSKIKDIAERLAEFHNSENWSHKNLKMQERSNNNEMTADSDRYSETEKDIKKRKQRIMRDLAELRNLSRVIYNINLSRHIPDLKNHRE